jgi:hypothetical protein
MATSASVPISTTATRLDNLLGLADGGGEPGPLYRSPPTRVDLRVAISRMSGPSPSQGGRFLR